MLRGLSVIGFLSLILLQRPVRACDCITSFGACQEAGISNVVFIGTVQSIEPIFMNRWYPPNQVSMRSLNDAYIEAQQSPAPPALARLKDPYLNFFRIWRRTTSAACKRRRRSMMWRLFSMPRWTAVCESAST